MAKCLMANCLIAICWECHSGVFSWSVIKSGVAHCCEWHNIVMPKCQIGKISLWQNVEVTKCLMAKRCVSYCQVAGCLITLECALCIIEQLIFMAANSPQILLCQGASLAIPGKCLSALDMGASYVRAWHSAQSLKNRLGNGLAFRWRYVKPSGNPNS